MQKKNTQLAFSIVPHEGQGDTLSTALDLSALEAHLWASANILRGPVDAADFKTYIFPLLFFKRISDVYDEEIASALAESDGDQEYALFPENHRFQLPPGCAPSFCLCKVMGWSKPTRLYAKHCSNISFTRSKTSLTVPTPISQNITNPSSSFLLVVCGLLLSAGPMAYLHDEAGDHCPNKGKYNREEERE